MHEQRRARAWITIPSSANMTLLNGANCSIRGCYDSDSSRELRIPTSSCIVGEVYMDIVYHYNLSPSDYKLVDCTLQILTNVLKAIIIAPQMQSV